MHVWGDQKPVWLKNVNACNDTKAPEHLVHHIPQHKEPRSRRWPCIQTAQIPIWSSALTNKSHWGLTSYPTPPKRSVDNTLMPDTTGRPQRLYQSHDLSGQRQSESQNLGGFNVNVIVNWCKWVKNAGLCNQASAGGLESAEVVSDSTALNYST